MLCRVVYMRICVCRATSEDQNVLVEQRLCSLCTEWSLSSLLTSVCMLCVCLCLCVSVLCVCTHTNVILCHMYVYVGMRSEISEADMSKVLPEEVEEEVRQAAEISMGTEVLYA